MPNSRKSREIVQSNSLYRGESQARSKRDRRVQIVRILIEAQFHRKLRLSEMGRAVSLSSWRLAHLFKAETGMSPLRYLTLVRLQKAKDQLERVIPSIREVGASVGMPNPSQFTKTFKAAYGMTPVEYRRTYLRIDFPIEASRSAIARTASSASTAGRDTTADEVHTSAASL